MDCYSTVLSKLCMMLHYLSSLKVEVVNPADRKINLGAQRIGKIVNRSVKIINNSMASIDFSVAITPSTLELQQTNILSISPLSLISLKPKATTDINVRFSPRTRIGQFSEEVRICVINMLV